MSATDGIAIGTDFRLWRLICLRSAGFRCEDVLQLASSRTSSAADALLDAEAELDRLRGAALARCSEALRATTGTERAGWSAAMQRVQRNKLEFAGDVGGDERAWRDAAKRLVELRDVVTRAEQEEGREAHRAMCALARDVRFRAATTWSNPGVVTNVYDRMQREDGADAPPNRTSKVRQREQAVALYLQRFATKNDSIGFFGPIGFAQLDPAAERGVTIRSGALPETRPKVFYENWALCALVRRLNADPRVRPHTRVRLSPRAHVTDEGAFVGRTRIELSPEELHALRLVDGKRSLAQLAVLLVERALAPDVETATAVVARLEDAGAATIGLSVAIDRQDAETLLAAAADAIADEAARHHALEVLGSVARARDAVAACVTGAGLQAELAKADAVFSEHAGVDADRGAGRVYTGRRIMYSDSRRDADVRLGASVVDALTPVLELLCASARWLSFAVSERILAIAQATYAELAANAPEGSVPYVELQERLAPHFRRMHIDPVPAHSLEAHRRMQERWAKILDLREGDRARSYETAALRDSVLETFAAPHSGAPALSHHCPDLMIAARGPDALARGDFRVVMGELHNAFHTFMKPMWTQHMTAAELESATRAYEEDLAGGAVITSLFRPPEAYTRVALPPRYRTSDYVLELGDARGGPPEAGVLHIADLVVERDGDAIVVRDRAGRRSFTLGEMLGIAMRFAMPGSLEILSPSDHVPRIMFDKCVVTRESWTFAGDDLAFVAAPTSVERFVGARRWRRTHDLPRFVFIKSKNEPKPVFVDLDSVTYVDLLCSIARNAPSLRVSEMLPSLDETWLTDAAGSTYTCELRMACADLRRPAAASHAGSGS